MKLRIYFRHHTNFSHDTKKYKITKTSRDFEEESIPSVCETEILNELRTRAHSTYPKYLNFAEICGSVKIDENRPPADVEFWSVKEQSLFTPEMAKQSLSDSRTKRARRKMME